MTMTATSITALFGEPRLSLSFENRVGMTPSKLHANIILTDARISVSLAPKTAAIIANGIRIATIGFGLAKTTRKLVSGGEARVYALLPELAKREAALMKSP